MNDSVWYYVDRSRQRQGPVTAAAVAEAWRTGDADDTSLVWREGLAEWLPLAHFREELGLAGESASPGTASPAPVHAAPAQAATATTAYSPPTALPAPPRKSGSGCLIAAIVGGLVLLFFLAILAAIALPAYQDYVERAKELAEDTAGDAASADSDAGGTTDSGTPEAGSTDSAVVAMALAEARQHQGLVDDFVANTDRCPRDPGEVAVPPVVTPGVAAITVGEARTGMCTIEVEFSGDGSQSLSGERLVLSRDIAGDWYCTSDMASRDTLPPECR